MKKITGKFKLFLYGMAGLGVNMLNLIVGSYLCDALMTEGFEKNIENWTYLNKTLVVAGLWSVMITIGKILDGIIEMIYALDKIAPGTANDDTLLYGVEVKFYNMEVAVSENLESQHKGLYIIGDGSGITHSLSHASASGIHVARHIVGVE